MCVLGVEGSKKKAPPRIISGTALIHESLCSDVVLLGKALRPHVHSLDPGVGLSGYMVRQ